MRKVIATRKGRTIEIVITETETLDENQIAQRVSRLENEVAGYQRQIDFMLGKQATAKEELEKLRLL